MSARLLRVLAGALVLGSAVHAAGHAAPTARLTGVATKTEGAGTTVVIETSEPVAYVAAQPDPLTLLVDLRDVSPAGVRPDRPSGAVADVRIEPETGEDGTAVARVRMLLSRPLTPVVRSRRNAVVVEFGAGAAGGERASAVPAAEPAAPPRPSPGSALTRVETAAVPDGTRVTFTGPGSWRAGTIESARDLPPRLVVDFPDLRSTLPAVTPVGLGPVDRIRVGVNRVDPLVTRAVIDLTCPVTHRVEPLENGVAIVLSQAAPARPRTPETASEPRLDPAPGPAGGAPPPGPVPVVVAAAASQAAPGPASPVPDVSGAEARPARQPAAGQAVLAQKPAAPAAPEGEKQYTGHLVTFDFFQADLRSVLRTFSEISGLNIVIDPNVPAAMVDVSLKEVPWDQALEVILRSHQLGYVLENNVVRIAPLKVLAQEETERQKLAEAQSMSGQLKVLTKTLSYAKAAVVAKLLKDTRVISNRGTAIVDDRTNTLIINDLPEALAQCEDLITKLDRSEPQVEIEARIVQTTTTAARAIGVQWGVNGRMASALANTAPVTFPAQSSVSGRTASQQGNATLGESSFTPTAVHLPATGATSALGISMGSLTGSFNLDVALSALEEKGQGKILSQPRVMMQNNFEAEMTQGVQIPIQTSANNTVTVTFKDAALTLKVRPQITASDTVMMSISLENASPDYSRSVNGIPPIDTQRAITQVLVNDNETMVIGGIMKSEETSMRDGVPGLSRIPLLRWLFRRDSMSADQRELLIFITPRIRR
ncbi:MAG TPA: type IV pilus secretin PilQ [Vicinamibacterales bacterium]|nr:type IV pilus secretin PilQ [Vicinamibacterales bacterium]HPW20911.1 type IV pilus secretin PilQ [Vicinamibacterales bacterium]